MGARRLAARAIVLVAVAVAGARAGAATVTEPIARLSVEGGWDSNALYDGLGGDRQAKLSPDVGLRVRRHGRLDLSLGYGLDYVVYQRRAPGGIWSHRASLLVEAHPTRRIRLDGAFKGGLAFDPVGLAQIGIFRAGRQEALVLSATGRAGYRATRLVDVAGTLTERTVIFDDRTGGAMHQPGVEALLRVAPRLSAGGAYTLGVFQDFGAAGTTVALSHGLRGRASYRYTRHLLLNAYAGPAIYTRRGATDWVPEGGVDALFSNRRYDVRLSARHALGIGSTARPSLVDSLEAAAVRRFDRRWLLHGAVGLWHSGEAPGGGNAITGYAITGEVTMLVGRGMRIGIGGSHFARLDDSSAAFRRTTAGLRVGWELDRRP